MCFKPKYLRAREFRALTNDFFHCIEEVSFGCDLSPGTDRKHASLEVESE